MEDPMYQELRQLTWDLIQAKILDLRSDPMILAEQIDSEFPDLSIEGLRHCRERVEGFLQDYLDGKLVWMGNARPGDFIS